MYRGVFRILFVSLLLASAVAAAGEDPPATPKHEKSITGSVGVALGVKILDSGWEPLGDQTVSIISLTIGMKAWPVHIALDYVSGEARDTRVSGFPFIPPFCCFTTTVLAESETTEWDLGVRRVWRPDKKFRPYAGGGVAFIDGELRVPAQGIFADESTTGYWLDAGFRAGAHRWWEWGIDLRASQGEVDLGNGGVEAGGPQALLYFGGRW